MYSISSAGWKQSSSGAKELWLQITCCCSAGWKQQQSQGIGTADYLLLLRWLEAAAEPRNCDCRLLAVAPLAGSKAAAEPRNCDCRLLAVTQRLSIQCKMCITTVAHYQAHRQPLCRCICPDMIDALHNSLWIHRCRTRHTVHSPWSDHTSQDTSATHHHHHACCTGHTSMSPRERARKMTSIHK